MPRYQYECQHCGITIRAFHSYKEMLTDCDKCESKDTLKKILSVPFYGSKTLSPEKQSDVGELTKEYIEENRELLQQQKEELKDKDYDKK
jgi:putative FmdB family regulatory protein